MLLVNKMEERPFGKANFPNIHPLGEAIYDALELYLSRSPRKEEIKTYVLGLLKQVDDFIGFKYRPLDQLAAYTLKRKRKGFRSAFSEPLEPEDASRPDRWPTPADVVYALGYKPTTREPVHLGSHTGVHRNPAPWDVGDMGSWSVGVKHMEDRG